MNFVLLVDDHATFREPLAFMFNREPEFEVIAEAGSLAEAKDMLEGIDLDTVGSEGYAFQVEMTYRAVRAGFAVVEVPITFRDRRVGESKMTGSIVTEAAIKVPALRFSRRAR